jgi:hypothetical protein
MTCTVYGLQCTADVPLDSVSDMALYYIQVGYSCHSNTISVKSG